MKSHLLALLAASVALVSNASEPASTTVIKHRFLAVDESRGQLLCVDQVNPAQSWTLKLPIKCRDSQLIGHNQILLNAEDGYYIYDLATRAMVKEFHNPAYKGTQSIHRFANGHTLLVCNQKGIALYELDANDALVKNAQFPSLSNTRLARITPSGTVLFGANNNLLVETDLDGKILHQFPFPAPAKHIYQAVQLPNGHLLAAAGYGHFLAELDSAGTIVKRIDSPASTPDNDYHFFAGFQVLKNGNIVQCNWTGHGAQDSAKGVQLVEFNPEGKPVWTWHDSTAAGSLHGVIVLDE